MSLGNVQSTPELAAIVLAAGASTRYGDINKLHVKLDSGTSVVESVLELVLGFPFKHRVMVVAPSDCTALELANRYSIISAVNQTSKVGVGTSIACGARTLLRFPEIAGAAIFLGDLPFVSGETIAAVASKFLEKNCLRITRPRYGRRVGHPVFRSAKVTIKNLSFLLNGQVADYSTLPVQTSCCDTHTSHRPAHAQQIPPFVPSGPRFAVVRCIPGSVGHASPVDRASQMSAVRWP